MSDNVVGQLKVLLTAELGGFVSDMGKAAHVAQQSAKDISREFASLQRVASQTFGAFGSFNPVISQLSFVLSTAGRAAADAMSVFSKLGAEMANSTRLAALLGVGLGTLAEFSVGSAIAMGAAGLSAIALAQQAAESAAKTYELAQATGVNVEALSALSFAAKQAGVDQETLARGLERMSKSAFAAATAPAGAVNAYTRLGITLKDTAGNIKSAEDLIIELSSRFASMPDSISKTADALEIFSKGGAALIPFLNEGPAKIKGLVEMAHALGTAFGEDVGKAAENFQSQLGLLGEAGEGLKLRLMQDLLPALQNVLSYMESDFAKGPSSAIRGLIDDVAALSKQVLAAGADFILLGKLAEAAWKTTPMGHWGGPQLHKMTDQEWAAKIEDDKKGDAWDRAWREHDEFIAALNAPPPVPEHDMRPPGAGLHTVATAVPYGAAEKDVIAEMIEKLQAQAAAEMQLAGATNLSTAAMLLQKAAGEGDQAVAGKRAELLAREKQLQEQLAGARANAATNTAAGEEAARLEKQIGDVRRMLGELEKDTPRIKQLYAEIATATEVTRIGGEFNKEGLGLDRKISGLVDLTVAYRQGNIEVANANVEKDLEEDKQKIAEIQELIAKASPFAASGPGPSGSKFQLEQDLQNATEQLEAHRAQLKQITALDISSEIAKERRAFIDESAAVMGLSSAYLESAAAVREFEVNRKVAQFSVEHPGVSSQQISDVRKLYQEQSQQEFKLSIAQEAPQFEFGRGAADAVERLQAIKDELEKAGKTTILVDFAIDKAGADDAVTRSRQIFQVENERLVIDASIYDAQREQLEQFDEMANKVGTLGDRFRALGNEIALEGQNFTQKIFDSFNKTIDGIEDQMAKLIVTGRSDFRKMFEGIEENLIKSTLQASFGKLAQVVGFGAQRDKESDFPLKPTGALLASLPIGPNGPAPAEGTPAAGGFFAGLQKIALGAIGIKAPDARAAAERAKPLGTRGDPIFVSFTGPNSLAGNAPQRPAGFDLQQLGAPGTATTPPIFSPLPNTSAAPAIDFGNGAGGALQEAGSIARVAGGSIPGPGGQTLRTVTSTISPAISLIKLLEQHGANPLAPSGSVLSSLPLPKNPFPDLRSITSSLPSDFGTGSPESAAAAAKSIQGVPYTGQDNSSTPQLFGPNGPSTSSTAIGLAGAGLSLASSITKFLQLLTPKEKGGPVGTGRSFLVGEKGPEIFTPDTAGTIIPNHAFAGFRAEGGDVAPGKSYLVGEQGFEAFQEGSARPTVPSSVFETNSSNSTSSRSRSSRTQHTVVNQNFPNVKDADNFRRSKGQVLAEFHAQASIANKRNGHG